MKLLENLFSYIKKENLYKSMVLSTIYKPLNMFFSFIYTPVLIAWLGNTKYGIWSTILSIINWINYFDVGIGNGLRNSLSRELAQKEYLKAKYSVSTAYKILFYICTVVTIIVISLAVLLNWKTIFNTDIESQNAVLVSFTFVCINLFLSLQKAEYYADQKAETVTFQGMIIQLLNLLGILIVSYVFSGELLVVAIIFSLSSFLVNIYYSLKIWKKANYFRPSWKLFDGSKVKAICGLGIKFFILQIAALILFTCDNIIITTLYGPDLVTPYNTVNKVFLAFSSVFSALVAPLWSKFTVAMEMKNYKWMRSIIRKMRILLIPIFIVMMFTVIFFQHLSDLWLGQHLVYESGLIVTMGLYVFSYIYSMIYATAMNGMGKVNLQVAVAVGAAVVNIPLSVFLATIGGLGTTGVCLATGLTSFVGNIIYTIYVNNIIKQGEGLK